MAPSEARKQTANQNKPAMLLPQESFNHVNGGQVLTRTDCGAFKVAAVHAPALKQAGMSIKLKRR